MSFAERVRAGKFAVALEITPPQKPLPGVLLRRARLIGDCAHGVNVIERPGRQSSLDASLTLRTHGMAPAWHLVVRGRSLDDLAADCVRARAGGIQQVLCIRGDHEGSEAPGQPTIREAVGIVCDSIPGALVGATFNQYARDRRAAKANLLGKLRAGATYVQTQPVFDAGAFSRDVAELHELSPGTQVVAMVMPLRTRAEAAQIEERLGIALPASFAARLDREDDAWAAFEETVAGLVGSGAIAGVAIMTFEMDPAPETGARIVAALERAGAA